MGKRQHNFSFQIDKHPLNLLPKQCPNVEAAVMAKETNGLLVSHKIKWLSGFPASLL